MVADGFQIASKLVRSPAYPGDSVMFGMFIMGTLLSSEFLTGGLLTLIYGGFLLYRIWFHEKTIYRKNYFGLWRLAGLWDLVPPKKYIPEKSLLQNHLWRFPGISPVNYAASWRFFPTNGFILEIHVPIRSQPSMMTLPRDRSNKGC